MPSIEDIRRPIITEVDQAVTHAREQGVFVSLAWCDLVMAADQERRVTPYTTGADTGYPLDLSRALLAYDPEAAIEHVAEQTEKGDTAKVAIAGLFAALGDLKQLRLVTTNPEEIDGRFANEMMEASLYGAAFLPDSGVVLGGVGYVILNKQRVMAGRAKAAGESETTEDTDTPRLILPPNVTPIRPDVDPSQPEDFHVRADALMQIRPDGGDIRFASLMMAPEPKLEAMQTLSVRLSDLAAQYAQAQPERSRWFRRF